MITPPQPIPQQQPSSSPSLAEKLRAQAEQAQAQATQSSQVLNTAKDQYKQYADDYASGKRNPIADLLRKPERDTEKEKRMQQMASFGLIGDAIGLIGKGYAASRGVKPRITEGATAYKAMDELKRLDDVYRQEGYNYDHQMMLDTLRRKDAADRTQELQVQDAKDKFNYDRDKAEKAQQVVLGAQMDEEAYKRGRADLTDQRKYNEAQDDKGYRRQAYLSGLARKDKEGRQYNPRNPLDLPKNEKGRYSTTFFGRTIPVTAEIEQDVAEYMASKGFDKAVYDKKTGEWRQHDFDWSKVPRDPNLQLQVGKFMEDMRLGLIDAKETDGKKFTDFSGDLHLNSINKILIPRLYKADTPQQRRSILIRSLEKVPAEMREDWTRYNEGTLGELGIFE